MGFLEILPNTKMRVDLSNLQKIHGFHRAVSHLLDLTVSQFSSDAAIVNVTGTSAASGFRHSNDVNDTRATFERISSPKPH